MTKKGNLPTCLLGLATGQCCLCLSLSCSLGTGWEHLCSRVEMCFQQPLPAAGAHTLWAGRGKVGLGEPARSSCCLCHSWYLISSSCLYLPAHLPAYNLAFLSACTPAYLPACTSAPFPACSTTHLPACTPAQALAGHGGIVPRGAIAESPGPTPPTGCHPISWLRAGESCSPQLN